FEWKRTDDGDVLQVRAGFTPLPFRGRLSTDRVAGYREYRLPPSSPAIFDLMVEFAIRELRATRTDEAGDPTEADLLLGGIPLHVGYYTDHATVYAPHGASSEGRIDGRVIRVIA